MQPTSGDDPINCSECGLEDPLLIHRFSQRRGICRLCTSCILRLNPHSFCPTCFQVYPPQPPDDDAISCTQCYSISHVRCAPSPPSTSPYICPLCVTNAPIFKLTTTSDSTKVLDRDSAKKLVAAAKIAFVSMKKAAVEAKAEAVKRAEAAVIARRKAKEALEHVENLLAWRRRLTVEVENKHDSSSGDDDDDDNDSSEDDSGDEENSEDNDGDDENSEENDSDDGSSNDDGDDHDDKWVLQMNEQLNQDDMSEPADE